MIVPFLTAATIGGGVAPNYFGNGSDGVLNTAGNVNFASSVDGDPVIKNYTSVTINSGHTVTTSNRCKALWIYCTGDVTINGTLSMTARGAAATGSNDVLKYSGTQSKVFKTFRMSASGGAGGNIALMVGSRTGITGTNGTASISGNTISITTGGGGSGGGPDTSQGPSYAGFGGSGSSYSGGPGGGGFVQRSLCSGQIDYVMDGSNHGGTGGSGKSLPAFIAGSGAGNPGGTGGIGVCSSGPSGNQAPSGTGGIIFIIAKGNVTIGSGGIISADGTVGGAYSFNGDGGGGSGGGAIVILRGGNYSNSGTIQSNGGAGGAGATGGGYGNGGVGGNGGIYITQIDR